MNCIFICVFNQHEYINMCYLLLESIFIYGNLNNNIEILIYTSTSFMNIIMNSDLFNNKIKFEINDTYDNIEKSYKSRLDFFNLKSTENYNNILFLDINTLIINDINKIFNLCQKDILYILNTEQQNENNIILTSHVVLFKNSKKIQNLFDEPNDSYEKLQIDDIVNYFYNYDKMNSFLNEIKENTIINNITKTKLFIDEYLMPIIIKLGEKLEGNIFMIHDTIKYTDLFINKVKNICSLLLNKNNKNIMEIGFNSGFSALLMLITNPNINILCFDVGYHSYTEPCYRKIKEIFGNRINIIYGNSVKTLTDINMKFDMIHIDGGHTHDVANNDIINSIRLSKKGTIIIMDDYDQPILHKLWDFYIEKNNLKSLSAQLYKTPYHDIKYI